MLYAKVLYHFISDREGTAPPLHKSNHLRTVWFSASWTALKNVFVDTLSDFIMCKTKGFTHGNELLMKNITKFYSMEHFGIIWYIFNGPKLYCFALPGLMNFVFSSRYSYFQGG